MSIDVVDAVVLVPGNLVNGFSVVVDGGSEDDGNVVLSGEIVDDVGNVVVVDDFVDDVADCFVVVGTIVSGGNVVGVEDFVDDVPVCFVVVGIIVIGGTVVVLFVPFVVNAAVTGRDVAAAVVTLPFGTLFVVVTIFFGISHFCDLPFLV